MAAVDDFMRWHAGLSPAEQAAFAKHVESTTYRAPATIGYEPISAPGGGGWKPITTPGVIKPIPTTGPGSVSPSPSESTGPTPEEQAAESQRQAAALDYLKATFPWIERLGGLNDMVDMVRRGLTPDGVVAEVRQKQWYKDRFVAITRNDGTMRMNEKEYMDTEEEYRKLRRQFNKYDPADDVPQSYKGLFENDLDPNEFRDRLDLWDQIDRSADDVKSTFYVYAGMRLSTDDLYQATVDPSKSASLELEYDRRVAAQPIDYDTWITRATEAGLEQTTRTLERLKTQGAVGEIALQTLRGIDPVMARDLADQLYRSPNAQDKTGRFLSLNELQAAFQYALLGSAASANGLQLPGTDRLESLRAAGVTRAKALEAYGAISTNKNVWAGALSRANLGTMDEADFEAALLINQGKERDMLERAQRYDESLAFKGGSATFGQDQQSGLLQQLGLRARKA